MLEKKYFKTKFNNNKNNLKISYSSLNISKLSFNPLDKTLKTNLKMSNNDTISKLRKPDIKKLLIIKEENKLAKNNENNILKNKKIPIIQLQ